MCLFVEFYSFCASLHVTPRKLLKITLVTQALRKAENKVRNRFVQIVVDKFICHEMTMENPPVSKIFKTLNQIN